VGLCHEHGYDSRMSSSLPRRTARRLFALTLLSPGNGSGAVAIPAFPAPPAGRLRIIDFEACSTFTRVTPCLPAEPPNRGPFHQGLRTCRYLHDRLNCFRPRRTIGGGPPTPAGWDLHPRNNHAFTAHGGVAMIERPSSTNRFSDPRLLFRAATACPLRRPALDVAQQCQGAAMSRGGNVKGRRCQG